MNQFQKIKIRIARVNANETDIPLPAYTTEGSSGMDIRAAVETELIIKPAETVLVPTGFYIEVPEGYEAQIRPRSGLAIKSSIGILNSPGTIDSDYRGEVKIILTNFGNQNFIIKRSDRIAQMIITPVIHAAWEEVQSLNETRRGSGGFGHTGK